MAERYGLYGNRGEENRTTYGTRDENRFRTKIERSEHQFRTNFETENYFRTGDRSADFQAVEDNLLTSLNSLYLGEEIPPPPPPLGLEKFQRGSFLVTKSSTNFYAH